MSYQAATFTPGARHIVMIAGLADSYAVLQTSANTACTVTLTNALTGASVLAATAMTAGVAGTWTYTVPVASWTFGTVLLATVTVYDQSGAGTVRATFDMLATNAAYASTTYRRSSINTVTLSALQDSTNTLQTSANASAYLKVSNNTTVLLTSSAMTYSAPGQWSLDFPAVDAPNGAALTVVVTAYDQTGSGGLQRWQQTLTALDSGQ